MASSKERKGDSKNDGNDDAASPTSNLTQVADRAKEAVKERLGARIDRSAGDLGLLAQTLTLASQQLKDNIAAPYVGKAATQIERLSKFIEEADPKNLLEGVETLGRKQPLAFIGGAFALGLAGSRFLKSSARMVPEQKEAAPQAGSGAERPAARRTAGSRI